jgi:hypothetical protein
MATQQITDETGAAQIANLVAGGVNFGSGTPTANFVTIDGTGLNNGSSKIGNSRAQPNASSRVTGSVTVNVGLSADVTHSLGRLPLMEKADNQNTIITILLTTSIFRLYNTGIANYSSAYAYI